MSRQEDIWRSYLLSNFDLRLDHKRLILVTGHRRENFGPGFEDICWALRTLAEQCPDIHIVYPVHLNPNVQRPVYQILTAKGDHGQEGVSTMETAVGSRITLVPPLDYAPFVYLMTQSYLVLTDSGGIQEEAPALGKPVLVMREVTERPEGVWAQTVKLVGTDRQRIFQEVQELLENQASYRAMAQARNPYGDGQAAARIVQVLTQTFTGRTSNLPDLEPWEPAEFPEISFL